MKSISVDILNIPLEDNKPSNEDITTDDNINLNCPFNDMSEEELNDFINADKSGNMKEYLNRWSPVWKQSDDYLLTGSVSIDDFEPDDF